MADANDTLTTTYRWFERAVPEPTSKNIHTQLGVHLEEVVEMLECLVGLNAQTSSFIGDAERALLDLSAHLKTSDNVIIIPVHTHSDMLDSLCDQHVTATGVAYMLGYKFHGAMMETNASNWSKFIDGQPIFDANRKIQKGPGYFKPVLEPYLGTYRVSALTLEDTDE